MRFEVIVLGSGFSGSLLAWTLSSQGIHTALVDRQAHPRFAIGESSTPLADFLLERIGAEFELPELLPLSRWGSWRKTYPHLEAGKKRGFSYFEHSPHENFHETSVHNRSLLVAASSNDELSDTHWMRSDVDTWFCEQSVASGTKLFSPAEILGIDRTGDWRLQLEYNSSPCEIFGNTLVDATGSGGVLAKHFGLQQWADKLKVRSRALFGHFSGVRPMEEYLASVSAADVGFPFNCDDAAQHHLIHEGWVWMLRFRNGITSVGMALDDWNKELERSAGDLWDSVVGRYPTLQYLLENATRETALYAIPRTSRLWSQAGGAGWVMLPSTLGVIDPLHSTGIAHALWGVWQIARKLCGPNKAQNDFQCFNEMHNEIFWIDKLIALAYQAKQHGFELFNAACTLYFISAIRCERNMAEANEMPEGFLCWKSEELQGLADWLRESMSSLPAESNQGSIELAKEFRNRVSPWNNVGLMEPSLRNRIARSAAPKG